MKKPSSQADFLRQLADYIESNNLNPTISFRTPPIDITEPPNINSGGDLVKRYIPSPQTEVTIYLGWEVGEWTRKPS